MTNDLDLHLLLDDEDGKPISAEGLNTGAARNAPKPDGIRDPEKLMSDGDPPDDLDKQGWGIIAPPKLLKLIEPLIDNGTPGHNLSPAWRK
ncbi:MAG: hypothetical protein MJE77_13555 [Proteobacteria bacterium]|nr:hypothetical protein [Pseudomonadota bacterium]